MANPRSKTMARSFRVNEQWLITLGEEADRVGISSNALMNKILQEYFEFQRYKKRVGALTIMQDTFLSILEECPEDVLIETARKASLGIINDLIRLFGFEYNSETAMFFITRVLAEYSNWFNYEHYIINNKEYFHLRHSLGEKWSIYTSEVVSTLLETCYKKKVKKEYTENTVTLEVL